MVCEVSHLESVEALGSAKNEPETNPKRTRAVRIEEPRLGLRTFASVFEGTRRLTNRPGRSPEINVIQNRLLRSPVNENRLGAWAGPTPTGRRVGHQGGPGVVEHAALRGYTFGSSTQRRKSTHPPGACVIPTPSEAEESGSWLAQNDRRRLRDKFRRYV
jgi:hypothetical protein